MDLEAIPPATAGFGLARPGLKRPVLTGPSYLADRQRRGVLKDHRIRVGHLAIVGQDEGQQAAQFDRLPSGRLPELAVRP